MAAKSGVAICGLSAEGSIMYFLHKGSHFFQKNTYLILLYEFLEEVFYHITLFVN